MSCGVSCRCGSDPALLWLWCRPVVIALIQTLAWELLYAIGTALKNNTKKKQKHKKNTKTGKNKKKKKKQKKKKKKEKKAKGTNET